MIYSPRFHRQDRRFYSLPAGIIFRTVSTGLVTCRMVIFSVKEIPQAAEIQTEIPLTLKRQDLPASVQFEYPDFQYAVRMQEVHIQYGNKQILNGYKLGQ